MKSQLNNPATTGKSDRFPLLDLFWPRSGALSASETCGSSLTLRENMAARFFLLFIVCLIVIGLPVLLAELAIGRAGRGSAATSFVKAGGPKVFGRLDCSRLLHRFSF